MSPKQKKLAAKAPPPNKLDEKDFKVLREEKAKGRGMGLQDESVQPGKVMKAKRGMSFSDKMKAVEDGKINKKTGKPTSMAAMREMKGFKPGESASEFNKRRMKLAGAKKALSATRIGKIVLPIAAAGVAAQQYLKSKMKKKEVKKKMGGGMMQRPMGYNTGGGTSGDATDNTKLKKTLKGAKDFYSAYKRDEQKVKKMGGGMMKKYSKGGGLDMGGPKAKIMQYIRDKKDDGQRLTMRDKEFLKSVMPKKMGGGMIAPSQRPGYSKGTMVKARGCKLGRTRPTKIT